MNNKSFITTIEARMTSSRLPGKVMMKIEDKEVISILIERIKKSRFVKKIILATTTNQDDNVIEDIATRLGVDCFRGDEKDVLGRLSSALKKCNEEYVIQLTGDNPLIDPEIINYMCKYFLESNGKYDFLTNNGLMNMDNHYLPLGMDVSIFKRKDLIRISSKTNDPEDREHPTLFFYRTGKSTYSVKNIEIPDIWFNTLGARLTLDTKEDLEVIGSIYSALNKDSLTFGLVDIYKYLNVNKDILKINTNIKHKIPSGLNE